jgi:hypothetical protein
MADDVLDEAYHRLHAYGPEWGRNQLTNHGPMAAEVLVRRGHADAVPSWVDRYSRRLDDLPKATDPVTDRTWSEAIGVRARLGDWTAYFLREMIERPWQEVLVTWWPLLLPGIVAGTTHSVIRVSHAVRALLAAGDNPGGPAVAELGHALAFWAAWAQPLPISAAEHSDRQLDPGAAIDALPRIDPAQGSAATRIGRVAELPDWPDAVAAFRPAATPEEAQTRLSELVDATTVRYLGYGHRSPVLLVHTATAPNAVLHTLPALPTDLWVPSLTAIWAVTAAIVSGYAAPGELSTVDITTGSEEDVLDQAVAHGDEHVIKFSDTAAEVYARTGNENALAAATHCAQLIRSPR